MKRIAQQHIDKAKGYADRGEKLYGSAADEMISARESGATWTEIADGMGRSVGWCEEIVAWRKGAANGTHDHAPFGGPGQDLAQTRSRTKKGLRDLPPEELAELLSEPEVRQKVHKAQDIASDLTEKRSRAAEREAVGAQESDDLAEQQMLRDAEGELFKARRALIETLRLLNGVGEALNDSWREEFLRTFDDVVTKAELGITFLRGGDLDDELTKLLAGEER